MYLKDIKFYDFSKKLLKKFSIQIKSFKQKFSKSKSFNFFIKVNNRELNCKKFQNFKFAKKKLSKKIK